MAFLPAICVLVRVSGSVPVGVVEKFGVVEGDAVVAAGDVEHLPVEVVLDRQVARRRWRA